MFCLLLPGLLCCPKVGLPHGHIMGLIAPANGNLAPSGFGLRPLSAFYSFCSFVRVFAHLSFRCFFILSFFVSPLFSSFLVPFLGVHIQACKLWASSWHSLVENITGWYTNSRQYQPYHWGSLAYTGTAVHDSQCACCFRASRRFIARSVVWLIPRATFQGNELIM